MALWPVGHYKIQCHRLQGRFEALYPYWLSLPSSPYLPFSMIYKKKMKALRDLYGPILGLCGLHWPKGISTVERLKYGDSSLWIINQEDLSGTCLCAKESYLLTFLSQKLMTIVPKL